MTTYPPPPPEAATISSHTLLFHVEQPPSKSGHLICTTAEFPIGHDEDSILQTVTVLVHYYYDSNEAMPIEGVCYYISSKLTTIHTSTNLPKGMERSMLDFQVDVFVLSRMEGKQCPKPPVITVCGMSSSNNEKQRCLNLDLMQFFWDGYLSSSYLFTYAKNSKFHKTIPLPQPNSLTCVTAIITGSSTPNTKTKMPQIPADIIHITFPGTKRKAVGGSPIKGHKSTNTDWLADNEIKVIRESSTMPPTPKSLSKWHQEDFTVLDNFNKDTLETPTKRKKANDDGKLHSQ
ncbi:hypothetical protein M422DRAFT_240280 [Sphaerobolus stellatus SS14]|nr:hypothetical protein M422DRAFT_240280 [Sphaerobolus stellatus SS14]